MSSPEKPKLNAMVDVGFGYQISDIEWGVVCQSWIFVKGLSIRAGPIDRARVSGLASVVQGRHKSVSSVKANATTVQAGHGTKKVVLLQESSCAAVAATGSSSAITFHPPRLCSMVHV
jgi:hypothetical protein